MILTMLKSTMKTIKEHRYNTHMETIYNVKVRTNDDDAFTVYHFDEEGARECVFDYLSQGFTVTIVTETSEEL